ncbi:hypothetical protein Z703_001746 [Salmonella enterica subsp. enterica serovar Livingstone]|uniref:Uncharacterized protein n=2 Tax=Salmonella enterica TaxID=28901 RepID=A0A764M086_SALER|nr:hypothetical protein [Salmonella enterica]EBQ0064105.1 hypothetical protein [Salmonella enterica subsp. enterica]ECI2491369.1 hypothetical protein [Salmonella enterica subsp. enterica serovar Enteritidis]EAY5537066.1 hypothetical protein [Salmonella enterica]EAY9400134.1 hypothetical protein [Salmonella enterica]EAY9512942.1 hypothetical protein [Salmonella enterica]
MQEPRKQGHSAVWWLCVTLSLYATQSDALVECRARKIADSGADLRSRGSKAGRLCRPQSVKVKGAECQQVQAPPVQYQPVKKAALRRNDEQSHVK